jgi:hypothetical protein
MIGHDRREGPARSPTRPSIQLVDGDSRDFLPRRAARHGGLGQDGS